MPFQFGPLGRQCIQCWPTGGSTLPLSADCNTGDNSRTHPYFWCQINQNNTYYMLGMKYKCRGFVDLVWILLYMQDYSSKTLYSKPPYVPMLGMFSFPLLAWHCLIMTLACVSEYTVWDAVDSLRHSTQTQYTVWDTVHSLRHSTHSETQYTVWDVVHNLRRSTQSGT